VKRSLRRGRGTWGFDDKGDGTRMGKMARGKGTGRGRGKREGGQGWRAEGKQQRTHLLEPSWMA